MRTGATPPGRRDGPVTRIARAEGGGYDLHTDTYAVHADKVVLAAPPGALAWIEGDVIDDLEMQAAFQDILAVKVVTVTQWWPEAWWEDVLDPDTQAQVWRGWTTDHCLNFIEIPIEPYAAAAKATRSVNNDNLDCANFWEALAAVGTDAVDAEIHRGLEHLFVDNGVTATVDIPDPIETRVQVWPYAWHWLRAARQRAVSRRLSAVSFGATAELAYAVRPVRPR